MSKEYKNIDELFKAELGQNSAKAPAFVKKNIDKQIQGNSNKWIFFLIPVVLLSLALPIYFWEIGTISSTAGRTLENIPEVSDHLSPITTNNFNENTLADSEKQSTGFNADNSTIDQKSNSDIVDQPNIEKSNLKFNPKTNNKSEKIDHVDDGTGHVSYDKNELTISNPDTVEIDKTKILIDDSETADHPKNPLRDDKNTKEDLEKSSKTEVIDTTLNSINKVDTTNDNIKDLIQNEKVDSVKLKDETAMVDTNNTNESIDTTNTVEIVKSEQKTKNWTFEAQVFGGIDFIQSKFSSLNPEAVNNFDSNKIKQLSSHFGLAGIVNYKGFSVGTGASFYSLSDEAEYNFYNYSNTQLDSSQTSFYYVPIYDSMGVQIDSTLDSTTTTYNYTVQDSSAATSQIKNNYKIISIPLSFGYTFNISNWAIKPRVSGIFEFSRQATTGNYPLLASGNSNLEQLQSLKFGFSMGLDIEFRRYFNRFYAFARPGYRFKMTNTAFNSSSGIKHNSFNAVLGIGYHFGR